MGKINILHLHQNSQVGGIQQQIRSLMRVYDPERFSATFCCLGPRFGMADEIERMGFDVVALGWKNYNRLSLRLALRLADVLKERDIHVLRAHKYRAALYGRVAAKMAGTPVTVCSYHGNYRKDKRCNRRLMNRLLAPLTDKYVAVSDSIAQDIMKYDAIDPSRIMVMHNGIDTGIFDPKLEFKDPFADAGLPEGTKVIGTVGRLVAAKGLDYLLEAFKQMLETRSDIYLVLLGEGSEYKHLVAKARELGISEKVNFAGLRRDIPDILARMDVFALPSIAEGLPNALLEAMSMEKAIVATPVGGVPELLTDNETGLLVPVGDVSALATAMNTLLDDAGFSARLGANARQLVEERYSIVARARQWEALYTSLLEQKGALP